MKYPTLIVFLLLPAIALGDLAGETRHIALPADGIAVLRVICGAGSLRLRGVGGTGSIQVTAEIQTEHLEAENPPGFIEDRILLNLTRSNDTALLRSEIQPLPGDPAEVRVNLTVTVPGNLRVVIDDGSGPIHVYDLSGDLAVDDGTGALTIENIVGNVGITDGSGPMVIDQVVGNVRVRDGSGTVEIQDIHGDVTVTDGSGDITILHVVGNVTLSDGSGDVDISDVSGNLGINEAGSGELHIEKVRGIVTIRDPETPAGLEENLEDADAL